MVRDLVRRLESPAAGMVRGGLSSLRGGGEAQRARARRLHERGEQRAVLGALGQRLGVPLDAEHERARAVLDGLGRAVGRPGNDAQARAGDVDGLVVEGVDLERRAACR